MSAGGGKVGSLGFYASAAAAIAAATILVGWPFLAPSGRTALLVSAALALIVQIVTFGALTTVPIGTNYFLGIWIGSTVMRASVIAGAAFLLAGQGTVDPVVALITLAGLFMAMIALELWVIIRDRTGAGAQGR